MYTEHETIYRESEDDWSTNISQVESVYQCEEVTVVDPETGELKDAHMCTENIARINFTIYKADNAEKGLVSGWANVAKNSDGSIPLDWQGDVIDPYTLEDAAIDFMLDYRESGELHKGDSVGTVVESVVLTKEKQAAMGIPEGTVPEGWFITVKLNDQDVIDKVKSGEYKMFSIQGTAERVAI